MKPIAASPTILCDAGRRRALVGTRARGRGVRGVRALSLSWVAAMITPECRVGVNGDQQQLSVNGQSQGSQAGRLEAACKTVASRAAKVAAERRREPRSGKTHGP